MADTLVRPTFISTLNSPDHQASVAISLTARTQPSTINTLSLVTHYGSYEFDRVIKQGSVLKRTRKTKSWKPAYIVLRPNLLSIYRDKHESKLKHQIILSELTAVARQRDPKRKDKPVFGLFSPSRNYHLEAPSNKEAQEWVELIRRKARMDEYEEEINLASPDGANASYKIADAKTAVYSSSDAEAFGQGRPPSKPRNRTNKVPSLRRASHGDYSGPEHGSYSDFSDSGLVATSHMSALSLAPTDGQSPPTSAAPLQPGAVHGPESGGPSPSGANASQMSGLALSSEVKKVPSVAEEERIVCHGWIYLLKSKSGVRQWKKVWMVLRPKQLAIYKDNEEYTAQLIIPFPSIINAVEIDPISRTKTSCMQIISYERNYRFCALDEESLAKWLGALKSLLSKRKAKAPAAN